MGSPRSWARYADHNENKICVQGCIAVQTRLWLSQVAGLRHGRVPVVAEPYSDAQTG
jgi:hypothetical protein